MPLFKYYFNPRAPFCKGFFESRPCLHSLTANHAKLGIVSFELSAEYTFVSVTNGCSLGIHLTQIPFDVFIMRKQLPDAIQSEEVDWGRAEGDEVW